jgi:hypothetical protein
MEDRKTEYSESGAPIYRYRESDREFDPAFGQEETLRAVNDHVQKYAGEISDVYHEILSDLVHVDVHLAKPRPERNYYTLVTSGMSDRPMAAPDGAEEFKYAELMLCLPPDWRLGDSTSSDEAYYWPVRWLKLLARFPHQYGTWLGWGHTIPNGDPPRPMAPNVAFRGVILASPALFPEEFQTFETQSGKTVRLYAVIPIYADEMERKLKSGADELLKRFQGEGVTELLSPRRPSVLTPRRRWSFGRN